MTKSADASRREERIVFMMSPSELADLDAWRHTEMIGTRAEAIRRLIVSGIARSETIDQLRLRLSGMDPDAAARAACGHPLVESITLQPTVIIHFHGGGPLHFVPGETA